MIKMIRRWSRLERQRMINSKRREKGVFERETPFVPEKTYFFSDNPEFSTRDLKSIDDTYFLKRCELLLKKIKEDSSYDNLINIIDLKIMAQYKAALLYNSNDFKYVESLEEGFKF